MVASVSTIRKEPMFDLDGYSEYPLWPLEVVMFFTKKNEDAVLNLIHRRLLEFAFDIRTKSAERRSEVRVLGESVKKYLRGEAQAERKISQKEINAAIESVFPKVQPEMLQFATITGTEFARRLFCSRFHVTHLIEEKLVRVTRSLGPRNSPFIVQSSGIEFLKERAIR